MQFPVAIETGNATTPCGVMVPDLPGRFSAGDTLDEAIKNSEEAILLSLEDYAERGEAFSEPSDLNASLRKEDFKGWAWFFVDVDTSKL